MFPEAENELGEIGNMLSGIMIEAGQGSGGQAQAQAACHQPGGYRRSDRKAVGGAGGEESESGEGLKPSRSNEAFQAQKATKVKPKPRPKKKEGPKPAAKQAAKRSAVLKKSNVG